MSKATSKAKDVVKKAGGNGGGGGGESSGTASSDTKYHVECTVLVYKNASLDKVNKRHVALYFQFENFVHVTHNRYRIHATGAKGAYSVKAEPGYNPSSSRQMAGKDKVGRLSEKLSPDTLVKELESVEPNNKHEDQENCQNWLARALRHMHDKGWISKNQSDNGIESMKTFLQGAAEDGEHAEFDFMES